MDTLKRGQLDVVLISVIAAAISVLQFFRVSPALPTVLKDEYLYSMMSRKREIEDANLGNFLFIRLYENTSLCGADFYSCARGLNFFFFTIFLVFIFLTARLFLSRLISFFLAVATGFGPLALHASVFMPEMMYFALVGGSLFFVLKYSSQGGRNLGWLAFASVFLASSTLVKPHGVFILVAITVYLVWIRRVEMGFSTAMGLSSGFLLVTLMIKLGLGYILAGPKGLTIFGDRYTELLLRAFDRFFGNSQAVSGAAQVSQQESQTSLFEFLFTHVALSFLALLFLSAPALGRYERPNKHLFEALLLIGFVTATMVITSSLFATFATASGDDHSDRLLLRYYEFALPFVLVLLIALIGTSKWRSTTWTTIVLAVYVGVFILVYLVSSRTWAIADSVFMYSVLMPDLGFTIWVMAGLVAIYVLFSNPKYSKTTIGISTSLAIGISGQIGISYQLERNSNAVGSDKAGVYLRENLPYDTDLSKVLFLGSDDKLVEGALFLADLDRVAYEIYPSGTLLSTESVAENYQVVVQTLGVRLDFLPSDTYQGDGFLISYFNE